MADSPTLSATVRSYSCFWPTVVALCSAFWGSAGAGSPWGPTQKAVCVATLSAGLRPHPYRVTGGTAAQILYRFATQHQNLATAVSGQTAEHLALDIDSATLVPGSDEHQALQRQLSGVLRALTSPQRSAEGTLNTEGFVVNGVFEIESYFADVRAEVGAAPLSTWLSAPDWQFRKREQKMRAVIREPASAEHWLYRSTVTRVGGRSITTDELLTRNAVTGEPQLVVWIRGLP